MKVEGEKVIEIDRKAEEVTIPPTATRICEIACFFGSIRVLDLENTNVIIIENHAFANCKKLEIVRFSSCLEEICEGAFQNCVHLENISFPSDSKLRKIGNNAFKYCKNLKQFNFPRLIDFIGDSSFDKCRGLNNFDLRETQVRHIGHIYRMFSPIYLPSTVSQEDIIKIAEDDTCNLEVDESHPVVRRDSCGYFFSNGTIFQGNKESRRVLIRRGVERIAGNCFYESKLVSVTIPSSVAEISDLAFYRCESLQQVCFTKDSLLRVIGNRAFFWCSSIKKIHFPKSLKIIKERAFESCKSLERVVFPQGSQLERIEGAFGGTEIKRLSLPPSVREIVGVSHGMENLESMFVNNEYYQSNDEGSAIFTKDGSELICVIKTLEEFKIPDSVRVIKKRAFYGPSIRSLIVPPSIEVIEEEAFQYCYDLIIDFQTGSRLKSLAFDAFSIIKGLNINNENFTKMENGVVVSLNPRGIVFVPSELTELKIPPGVEVIYSHAFYRSDIKRLEFPKSLKKICSFAFKFSYLIIIYFEEGTMLDFIGNSAFYYSKIKNLKLPPINGDLEIDSLNFQHDVIKFPSKLNLKNKEIRIYAAKIICNRSILSALVHFEFDHNTELLIYDDTK